MSALKALIDVSMSAKTSLVLILAHVALGTSWPVMAGRAEVCLAGAA